MIFPSMFTFSFQGVVDTIRGVASTAIDFVPIAGNIKGLGETLTGKDYIAGKNLTITERAFSLLSAIPFGNYLKNLKHLKNGQKFFKAAKRAKDASKIKNAVNFAKAGTRAMKKANFVQNIVKGATKITNGIFKQFWRKNDNSSDNVVDNVLDNKPDNELDKELENGLDNKPDNELDNKANNELDNKPNNELDNEPDNISKDYQIIAEDTPKFFWTFLIILFGFFILSCTRRKFCNFI